MHACKAVMCLCCACLYAKAYVCLILGIKAYFFFHGIVRFDLEARLV